MENMSLINDPEFQERANGFVSEILKLAGVSPDVEVDCENTTLAKIKSSPHSAEMFSSVNMHDEAKQVRGEGHLADIESGSQNTVTISIWAKSYRNIVRFVEKIDSASKRYKGEIEDRESGKIQDNGENVPEKNRFEVERRYIFR